MSDEIQITIWGIIVVFLGLILTSLLIYSFSFLQKYEKYKKKVKYDEIIPPDIIAVLTTILEIELRLKISLNESKFTFRRSN